MYNEKQGELAFKINKQIADNELRRRQLFANNIILLKEIKENDLYKTITGEDSEWVAYLGQIETFYSRSEVYNWFRIHDKFVTELGYSFESICDIPVSRLLDIISIATKDSIEHLLDNARILTGRDFKDTIREYKGLSTTDTCEHDYKQIEICKICGEKHEANKRYEENK